MRRDVRLAAARVTLPLCAIVTAMACVSWGLAVRLPGSPKGCSVASPTPGAWIVAEGVPFLPDDFGDRYAIERELGHGATATVYLARDLKFDGRLVAIKVLSPHFALAVPSARFLREIRTTAKLNHPHIVPLFDADTTRGTQQRPFYVMRFIDGEVLRDTIARGPLPLGDALRITRQAATALSHAHRHGVIHRDIKPGNIMLEDGHTWVTDFGIARAMIPDDGQTVTNTGITIGTPAYMSPEQALGRGDLDPRSDIYSLGCVFYEMLAGKMPFEGPDVQAVMTRRLVEELPPIRDTRPDVGEQVAQLLEVALAKRREDRFPTAAEFAEALSLEGGGTLTPTRTQPVPGELRTRVRWTRRKAAVAGAASGLGVLAMAAWMLTRPALREDHYFMSPRWAYEGVDPSMNVGRLLQDALNEWSGIKIVGATDARGSQRARALARDAEAGWYITGAVSRVGDSVRVRAALFNTSRDSLVRERAVTLPRDLSGSDAAFTRLADRLLFDDTVWTSNGGRSGTRSVAARRHFAAGLSAVQNWRLDEADSAFQRASGPEERYGQTGEPYPQAALWLAQVRYWQDAPPATWSASLEVATVNQEALSVTDQRLAGPLRAIARNDVVAACNGWRTTTRQQLNNFAAWYGLATCLSRDNVVVADPHSPNGLRFRTSRRESVAAYKRAFHLLPAIHRSLRGGSFEFVQRMLLTNTGAVRYGHTQSDTVTRFIARPAWVSDTLALIPDSLGRDVVPKTFGVALRKEQALFHDIATAWVTAYPRSADAWEALAISLDLLGDPTAADTLRKARAFATTDAERVRVAVAEVILRLRFAIPFDVAGVREAREVADGILDQYDRLDAPEPVLLATLAVLAGRGARAAAYMRQPAALSAMRVPAQLARAAGPLLVFAALGGPVDSALALEEQVDQAIRFLPDSLQENARMVWLARAAQLVFPEHHFASLESLAGHGDYMIDAQVAFLNHDTTAVRRMFDTRRARRRALAPGSVTLDALYPEARLLHAIGEPQQAIAWLDPTLSALRLVSSEKLSDPVNAGALVQAMALRSQLATLVHDEAGAARWGAVVRELSQTHAQ
jgi:tRNA A-37 threonylcarbamoyl transferase component Bud32